MLFNNSALYSGGSVFNYESTSTFFYSTFTKNSANTTGIAIHNTTNSLSFIYNSIIWEQDGELSKSIFNEESSSSSCSYSDISGSGGSQNWDSDYGNDGGGNIDIEPLFKHYDCNDFRLSSLSPCIDAGDSPNKLMTTDIRGKDFLRNLDKNDASQTGTIDMGTYEYNNDVDDLDCFYDVYVNSDYDNSHPCWEITHFDNLGDALSAS